MHIEKKKDGTYRIFDGKGEVTFPKSRYEDIYYAIPVDTTAFYRLLTEAVCRTDEERKRMVAMINGLKDMDAGLKGLQDQVQKLGC